MRYFCYMTTGGERGETYVVETVSEEDIREDYWPHWYHQMCKKFGKEHVDETYSFHDCLDDWIVVNWAWESTDEQA